jgi:hypothetical protein
VPGRAVRSAAEREPVENIWQFLRQNHLANSVFDYYDAIVAVSSSRGTRLIAMPPRLASITMRDWARVNG